jgi:hypothetical protein
MKLVENIWPSSEELKKVNKKFGDIKNLRIFVKQ